MKIVANMKKYHILLIKDSWGNIYVKILWEENQEKDWSWASSSRTWSCIIHDYSILGLDNGHGWCDYYIGMEDNGQLVKSVYGGEI